MSSDHASYTTVEVARRLGVSLQTVQRWVDAGQLRAWKTLGGHRRIEADSAESLFQRRLQAASVEPATSVEPAPVNASPCVLIADDDAIDRELLIHLVRKALPGASIETAENGFQALVAVGRCSPAIVVTDIHMPHMNGFEMIRHLCAAGVGRPRTLVAVSALSARDLAALGQLPPDVLFLTKPVDEKRFVAALRQGLPTPTPLRAKPPGPGTAAGAQR